MKKNEDESALHIYLDENADKPDNMDDLHPNGFTREGVFTDFPLRGQEVLLHVRRRRWLDENGESVMTGMDLMQEHTRCSKEFAAFLKEAAGHSPDKWTDTQKERAEILFREFPKIKEAFALTHSLRMIFSQRCDREQGRASLKAWYVKVGEFGNKAFNDIAAAMYDREDEIVNYFVNRATNASAESFNAKI